MHLRRLLALLALVALCLVPVALADSDDGGGSSAKGDVTWAIPLPNDFGVHVDNVLDFKATKSKKGKVRGRFHYEQTVEGETFIFDVNVTCMVIYDGNRAKIGGVITRSNDATQPAGRFAWFQVFDLGRNRGGGDDDDDDDDGGGRGPADRSSLIGFGDEAANEAFCNSPNLPRFGPWDVDGDIRVRP
jgi:hypothetical protein